MTTKQTTSGTSTPGRRHDIGILLFLMVARAINALAIKTFFQPDEYFQSLEPAWQAAFGSSSGAWITWEWREGLRSSMHPLLFAGVYRAVAQLSNVLGLTVSGRSELLIAAPKLVQAGFAAAMDFFTYNLASKTYGYKSGAAYAALFLTIASPWQAFCSVRTLSNSMETSLTIFALSVWPWEWFMASSYPAESRTTPKETPLGKHALVTAPQQPLRGLYGSLAAAAFACILRPTNIIVWATVSVTLLIQYGSLSKLVTLAQAVLFSGGAILAVSISADSTFYDAWTFPPLRFLQFNLVQSLAVFYGKNRPDYYLTEGLPLLLTTALPFASFSLWMSLRAKAGASDVGRTKEQIITFTLATAIITSVLTLSLISHKEVRFIYPLLPMLHILAAKPLAAFSAPSLRRRPHIKHALLLLMIFINVLIAWYTLFVHQRGVIDVLHYLRGKHEARITEPWSHEHPHPNAGVGAVLFLMPCHSTPWRSHLVHSGINAHALSCEPPLNLTLAERETYMDEADIFYDDPTAWVMSNIVTLDNREPWPEYLVFFEHLEGQLSSIFRNEEYEWYLEDWRGFNTHWHDDSRRHGDVIVWRKIQIRSEL